MEAKKPGRRAGLVSGMVFFLNFVAVFSNHVTKDRNFLRSFQIK